MRSEQESEAAGTAGPPDSYRDHIDPARTPPTAAAAV